MKRKALKLLLSSTAASLAALSLTASTFAYVLISNNVLVQDFSFEIEGQEGLNISLDGENWSQDITTAQLKAKIEESLGGASFDDIKLEGVTPKQKYENNKYVIDNKEFVKDSVSLSYDEREYTYQETSNLYIRDNNGTYVKDGSGYRLADSTELGDANVIKYSQRTDLYYEFSENNYQPADSTIIEDGNIQKYEYAMNPELGKAKYTHEWKAANENSDYITFDLYFKAISTGGNALTNFKLTFGENTKMAISPNANKDITVLNAFTVNDGNADKSYRSGDSITQDVTNAMRLGVSLYDYDAQAANPFEESDDFSIFEVTNNYDLGSAAIKGRTDAKHSPANSVMLNYYNVTHPLYPFEGDNFGAVDGEAFDTITQYGSKVGDVWTGETIGNFNADGIMKVKFYIWLEGWDADYLLGTSEEASKINANFEFVLERI